MTALDEIPDFPKKIRERLQRRYGIVSAETFLEHVLRNRDGLARALALAPDELNELEQAVTPYVPQPVRARMRKPTRKHPRGVITSGR